jgi:hypothetical protein
MEVYTSCEAFGAHAEYIRDGFDWNKWIHNLGRLHTEGNIKKTHMMMTINSLCLASIVQFMDQMMEFKKIHNTVYPTMSLNILRFPSFQSCAMLPTEIRQKYKDQLQVWLDNQIAMDSRTSDGKQMLMSIEREQTQRLIDYLDVIKTPHKNVKDIEQNRRDFKQFYAQYDVRRGKNFRYGNMQSHIKIVRTRCSVWHLGLTLTSVHNLKDDCAVPHVKNIRSKNNTLIVAMIQSMEL